MRIICLISAFLIFTITAASAQEPLTFEQARELALEKVPGVVVDTERSIHNGAVVYEFDIRQDNGAVMDIEIDSVTREILELKVDKIGTGGILPEPPVSEGDAQVTAIKHIEETTSGLRGVDVLKSEYTIVNQNLVYVFQLKRGISSYEVIVDANNGSVISTKETD